jgi:hypothetical protein
MPTPEHPPTKNNTGNALCAAFALAQKGSDSDSSISKPGRYYQVQFLRRSALQSEGYGHPDGHLLLTPNDYCCPFLMNSSTTLDM